MKIGLLVNPVAGLGGAVGLKGTDGKAEHARLLGAQRRAHPRAVEFVRALPDDVTIVTSAGAMGEDACMEADVSALVVHSAADPTSAADTIAAARALAEANVDLIVFVGGDGTAADVAAAIGDRVPALGVPAGVKMYSAVFADTPLAAAHVATTFDKSEMHEVLDIDEDAFRRGELRVALKGALRVPAHARMQAGKVAGDDDEVEVETLAAAVVEVLDPGRTYVLGAGTTMLEIKKALGIEGTLLGLDVVHVNDAGTALLLVKDAKERDLLDLAPPLEVVLSPIGSQGFFLGRGNLPLTPAVLSKVQIPEGVRIVATPWKLLHTPALKVDTGDVLLDARFSGYRQVITGYGQTKLMRVVT